MPRGARRSSKDYSLLMVSSRFNHFSPKRAATQLDLVVAVVVGEEFLFQVVEQDDASRACLMTLIQEGDDGKELSREEGFARLRAEIQQFKDKPAIQGRQGVRYT